MTTPVGIVAGHIAQRYAHPGRTAYTYLFQIQPGSDFGPLVPEVTAVISAWVDEGDGLSSVPPALAVERCRAALSLVPDLKRPQKLSSHQRRQMMARSTLFSADQTAEALVEVRLISRALAFTPKGDREALEQWRPVGEDWYSAYRPQPEP